MVRLTPLELRSRHPLVVVRRFLRLLESRPPWRLLLGLIASVVAVAAVTAVIYLARSSVPVLSLGVLYLFAVLPVAIVWGRAFSILVALASMLAFNFFFLPPVHTFTLLDERDWFALAVYLVTAVVVSDLASRARRRAAEAEQREREETLLAELSIALLQGEEIVTQLDRIAKATAAVLGISTARLELGPRREPTRVSSLELRANGRLVGTLYIDEETDVSPAVRQRFLPALASLLAVAVDRVELEREALAAETLRLSDSVKTAILRAVSHDLRSPLTAIRVAAESLASPSVTLSADDRARQLDTVRRESARLDRLVANLLDLSRLQAGSTVSQPELVSVDELVGQALSDVGGEDRVRVKFATGPPLIEVDPVQVERVLVNLLENALRYSRRGSDVLVAVTSEGGEAVVRVVDDGPGIPAAEFDRVFEPFQRLDSADGRRGIGLGLAIARGLAEANGGRVWIDSRPGRGASFAVAFPLARAIVESER
jgi:two-component system sensor histidine kinase KdpD